MAYLKYIKFKDQTSEDFLQPSPQLNLCGLKGWATLFEYKGVILASVGAPSQLA